MKAPIVIGLPLILSKPSVFHKAGRAAQMPM
jgi:hypothetical protein